MTVVADVANMVNTNILIGIFVGVFLAGIGGAYTIFASTDNRDNAIDQSSELMKQMIDEMTRHHKVMEDMMTKNMMQYNMTDQSTMGNKIGRAHV